MPTSPRRQDQIVDLRRSDGEGGAETHTVTPIRHPPEAPTVFEAMREFWWVILFTVLVGAGSGAAYGALREPTYTAESRLSVGRIDVATQSITNFAIAAVTLADSYSRAIVAKPVVEETTQRTGLTREAMLDQVSASPIPQSPVMRVLATDDSEADAVRIANAASRSLIGYVHRLNRFNPQSKELLRRFHRASEKYSAALAERARVGSTPSIQSKVTSARLEVITLGGLYQTSQEGQAAPNTLQILALATDASSDANSALQRAMFAGVVFGFVIGAGIALLISRRYG